MAKGDPYDYDGDGKPNTKKDKALADQDLNNDGYITKADETLRQDRLSMELVGRDYNFAYNILASAPEIQTIFETAISQNWTADAFEAAIKGSPWYEEIGGQYAREAWFSKTMGGADWEDQMVQARDAVERQAAALGVQLGPGDIDSFAERYLFEGWFAPGRQGLMMDAMASRIDSIRGGQIATRDALSKIAYDNGVSLNDQWYVEVAQAISRGEATEADYEQFIREQAANKYPLYADRIRQGVSVRSLASPYLQRMSELLELNVDSIGLDDPYINEALGQINPDGTPMAMSFTDFETKLRNDPRWENTNNGKNTLLNMATRMMQDWGFVK